MKVANRCQGEKRVHLRIADLADEALVKRLLRSFKIAGDGVECWGLVAWFTHFTNGQLRLTFHDLGDDNTPTPTIRCGYIIEGVREDQEGAFEALLQFIQRHEKVVHIHGPIPFHINQVDLNHPDKPERYTCLDCGGPSFNTPHVDSATR